MTREDKLAYVKENYKDEMAEWIDKLEIGKEIVKLMYYAYKPKVGLVDWCIDAAAEDVCDSIDWTDIEYEIDNDIQDAMSISHAIKEG